MVDSEDLLMNQTCCYLCHFGSSNQESAEDLDLDSLAAKAELPTLAPVLAKHVCCTEIACGLARALTIKTQTKASFTLLECTTNLYSVI